MGILKILKSLSPMHKTLLDLFLFCFYLLQELVLEADIRPDTVNRHFLRIRWVFVLACFRRRLNVVTAAVSEAGRLRSEFLRLAGKVQERFFLMRLISFLLNYKNVLVVLQSQFSDDVILLN